MPELLSPAKSMDWTKTQKITVSANKEEVTQVNVNEWFIANPSFMLGRPAASQLRSATGNWAASCAVEPEKDQDTIAMMGDRLNILLKGTTTMSKITASKFASNSMYSFILEVTRGSDAIIHFPPDATWNDKFIERIKAAGFTLSDGFWITFNNQSAIAKARSWVKSCVNYGAFELDVYPPSELPDIRRDVVDTLADQICDRVSKMLTDTRELEALRSELEECRKQLQERDAKIAELEENLAEKDKALGEKSQHTSDLQKRLTDLLGIPEPMFEDDEPVFEDDEVVTEPEPTGAVEEPAPEEEEEGFGDLDLLTN